MKKPVLFLTLFIVLLLAACGRTTEIDLAEYIHYETGGVNGKGKMFLSVDERLYADAAAKNEKLSVDALRKIVEQDVTLSAAKDRLLSNGDEVEIKISCVSSEEEQKAAGVRFVTGSRTVTVSGLREPAEIDLTGDILIGVQGFDGAGTLSVGFAEKLYNTVADLSRDMTTEQARELLAASVALSADKKSGLSDGDTVRITVDASNVNAAFLEQGLVLTGGEVSYTVNGLQPLTHFSASDYVSYSFTGTAPYLTVDFSLSENVPEELAAYFTLPGSRRLTFRKGETREFELKYNGAELTARGYVCDAASFSVSADGFELEKYPEELSEISDTELQKVKDETKDRAYAEAVNETKHLTYNEGNVFGDTVKKVTLLSTMLFVRKHYSDTEALNYLALVYRADYSLTSGNDSHDSELYVMVICENVKLEPDGSVMHDEPAVEVMLPDSFEENIAVRKADYELEEITE